MCSQKSIDSRMHETEEEDEEVLRRAALKTMSRFRDRHTASPNASQRSGDNNRVNRSSDQTIRTNNTNKANNYQSNSHRNASKRSNLIVLTESESESMSSQTNSPYHRFTKIVDKTSYEVQEKRKRVLPGRFSRLEREDTDEESDDECSDDYSYDNTVVTVSTVSAFGKTSDEESDNTTADDLVSTKTELNEETNESIDKNSNDFEKSVNNDLSCVRNETINGINEESFDCLASTSSNVDNDYSNGSKQSSCVDNRKETIKLVSNNDISKSDRLERRKQKFGQTVTQECVRELEMDFQSNNLSNDLLGNPNNNNNNNNNMNTNNRISVKNRLFTKTVGKETKLNSNSNNYINSNNIHTKEGDSRHKLSSNGRLGRQLDSSDEFDDCDNQSPKKRLRSLVVIK